MSMIVTDSTELAFTMSVSFAWLELNAVRLTYKLVKGPQTKHIGLVYIRVRVEEAMYLPHLDQHHLVGNFTFMS